MPIPSDSHVPGDTGHVSDHNAIADVLTALSAATAGETTRAEGAEAGLMSQLTQAAVLTASGTANCSPENPATNRPPRISPLASIRR